MAEKFEQSPGRDGVIPASATIFSLRPYGYSNTVSGTLCCTDPFLLSRPILSSSLS